MGILDDAIREHLELKRSHGASETEIKQKEAEAFGAPRQEAAPVAPEDEHTQLLTPEEHGTAAAELEPLQPAPEDPYAVHPSDELVPDPEVPHVTGEVTHLPTEEHHEPAVDAGAETFEPTRVEPGPPLPPLHDHHHDEQHPALIDHDHIGGEEHAPEPVFGHAAAPVEEPPVEEPPVEEPPVEQPPDEEDEDVLEDTPEFLQDAPEHDRLWFEQKPPRDFDFDE
jgi:hypothetical protein